MFLVQIGLTYMGFEGAKYTWCKKYGNNSFVQERLYDMFVTRNDKIYFQTPSFHILNYGVQYIGHFLLVPY